MNAIAEKSRITSEALRVLPEEKNFELVDGELVARNVSGLSSWVGGNLSRLLGNHVEANQLGWVFPADNGYQCFPDRPNTVRKPDVSFVRLDRLGLNQIAEGYLRIVPDLVVEVISPNDLAEEVEEKVEMFHQAGVPLLWVISPTARTVRILRSDGSTSQLREGEELSGEGILPGFSCPVASLFPPRPPVSASGAATKA